MRVEYRSVEMVATSCDTRVAGELRRLCAPLVAQPENLLVSGRCASRCPTPCPTSSESEIEKPVEKLSRRSTAPLLVGAVSNVTNRRGTEWIWHRRGSVDSKP
jgi:hypothetical protein